MSFFNKRSKTLLGAGALALVALSVGTARYAKGSDHAGTVVTAQRRPGTDLSDLHIFPSPTNPDNVVLSMSVHPLIPAGTASGAVSFDNDVLYQFKIDNTGDNVEDLVIQARFTGSGASQRVYISGPVKPTRIGTTTQFETPYSTIGTFGNQFSPSTNANMKIFAGMRADPFFIDLSQLFAILPDRADPLNKTPKTDPNQANVPQQASFRSPGQDFLANYNVLAIVVELPKSQLIGTGGGKIRVWETTSIAR